MKSQYAFAIITFLSTLIFSNSALALNCQNAETQSDMNKCFSMELDRETKKINKIYNDYMKRLNPSQQQQLKEIQFSWIKFKDLDCKFESSGVEGGSAHSMILSSCLTRKTRERIKELESFASCTEGDLSCPVPQ